MYEKWRKVNQIASPLIYIGDDNKKQCRLYSLHCFDSQGRCQIDWCSQIKFTWMNPSWHALSLIICFRSGVTRKYYCTRIFTKMISSKVTPAGLRICQALKYVPASEGALNCTETSTSSPGRTTSVSATN